jgi:glucose-1-phosphate thymidylyltransferase
MKGMVLAGGHGTRLYPLTAGMSKQLLPIYNKPALYYPLATLLESGIRDILLITTPRDLDSMKRVLWFLEALGVSIRFFVQDEPKGIAECYLLAAEALEAEASCLILGDNLFFGEAPKRLLMEALPLEKGAHIFASRVKDPNRYGVVCSDEAGQVVEIIEKPLQPKSPWAITGLYLFDKTAPEKAADLKPSLRGELEITDLQMAYLREGTLKLSHFPDETCWLDSGTYPSLLSASQLIQAHEERTGQSFGCLEAIALKQGWISKKALAQLVSTYPKGPYRLYVETLCDA